MLQLPKYKHLLFPLYLHRQHKQHQLRVILTEYDHADYHSKYTVGSHEQKMGHNAPSNHLTKINSHQFLKHPGSKNSIVRFFEIRGVQSSSCVCCYHLPKGFSSVSRYMEFSAEKVKSEIHGILWSCVRGNESLQWPLADSNYLNWKSLLIHRQGAQYSLKKLVNL